MKKTILFLSGIFVSIALMAQLDTAVVRGVTFKSSDLDYLTSYLNVKDSAQAKVARFIRLKSVGAVNSTNITLDSIPGQTIVDWYRIIRQIPSGEAGALGNAPKNVIQAITHPVIVSQISFIDAPHTLEFIRHRREGKIMNKDGNN